MLNTTIGQMLVNDALPEDLRDHNRVLDKKGVHTLLQQVGRQHPEKYREIAFALSQVGQRAAQDQGGMSFGMRHLKRSTVANQTRERIQAKLGAILADDNLTDQQRNDRIVHAVGSESEAQQKAVLEEAIAGKNPLAMQVLSGSRGKPMNLASLLASDMLYSDHRDEVIPIPVLRSYSEGLTPEEYWAGTYGARRGIIATKFATQEAGFLSKQLNQAGHRLVVMGEDGDDDAPDAPSRGMIVDTDDMDNEGALLARDAGPYKRNTPLTPKILKQLKRLGQDRILVRSPLVGGSPEGGVYARDVGIRENGTLPGRGEQVGLQAAQALSEPISQGQLCLAAGTLVRMADWSVRPIEQVVANEWVLGADNSGKTFPVRVVRTYDNGLRDCVRTVFTEAKTQQTAELISTGDHKLLAKARYWALPSERVEFGVFPVSQKCVGYSAKMAAGVTNDHGQPEAFALLCGLLLGDGCYTNSVTGVHWSCFEPDLVEEVQPYLASLGLRASKLKCHVGYYRISQIQDKVRQDEKTGQMLAGVRNPILVWLHQQQLYGKYAHEKRIPDSVWDWDQDSVASLLGGLYATDGSVYLVEKQDTRLHVTFSSTSLILMQQIKELLRVRFAVHGSSIGSHKGARKRQLYSFSITRQAQVRRFATQIGIPGRKGRMLADRLAGLPQDDIAGYYHRRLQEVVGVQPTYDLEVDHADHLFVLANGLIVSNSAKHSGGVAGQEKAVGGFAYINQLIQTPKKMQGGAAHATVDGMVQRIEPAPAGGHYVTIGGEKHYVGEGFDLKVKKGDEIEAGDMLSDGIPNPAIITRYKGVGEGRRYFVNEFRKAMAGSGMQGHRRNIELLARGLINHVQLTEETDDNAPDDIVPYSTLEHTYKPREGHERLTPKKALGQYLERPVLHYTIGTKIRPSMLRDFDDFGVQEIPVHRNPPPFVPHMVRGMYQLQHDPDWMTQMYGSGLKKSLLESVARGGTSEERGTSFIPSLATGTDFGEVANRAVIQPKPAYALPKVPVPEPEPAPAPGGSAFFGGRYKLGMQKRAVEATPTKSEAPASSAPSAPTAPPSVTPPSDNNIMPPPMTASAPAAPQPAPAPPQSVKSLEEQKFDEWNRIAGYQGFKYDDSQPAKHPLVRANRERMQRAKWRATQEKAYAEKYGPAAPQEVQRRLVEMGDSPIPDPIESKGPSSPVPPPSTPAQAHADQTQAARTPVARTPTARTPAAPTPAPIELSSSGAGPTSYLPSSRIKASPAIPWWRSTAPKAPTLATASLPEPAVPTPTQPPESDTPPKLPEPQANPDETGVPPVAPAPEQTGSLLDQVYAPAKDVAKGAVTNAVAAGLKAALPQVASQGAKTGLRRAAGGVASTLLPGVGLAGGAGVLPALGGMTLVNGAMDTMDAAGLLPEFAGGDGLGNVGWDQQAFDQATTEGSYLGRSWNALQSPVKSLWTLGQGVGELGTAAARSAYDSVRGR